MSAYHIRETKMLTKRWSLNILRGPIEVKPVWSFWRDRHGPKAMVGFGRLASVRVYYDEWMDNIAIWLFGFGFLFGRMK